jgi:peptidoglycan/xylan/chitin deacetylase (PgdA/CDA1 family)
MAFNDKTYIFCFHRISDEYSPAYPPIPINVFDKICRYISKQYCVIPLHALHEKPINKKTRAIITFDDAYYDFYEHALPVLTKHKLPAVQHVITSCAETGESFWTQQLNKIVEGYHQTRKTIEIPELAIKLQVRTSRETEHAALSIYKQLLLLPERMQYLKDLEENLGIPVKQTKMMQWADISDSQNHGICFGSHTHTHANLTKLSQKELDFELRHSAALLQQHIKAQDYCPLAFPNGMFNDAVVSAAKNAGYNVLFSTEAKSYNTSEMFPVLPRFSLYHQQWWKNHLRLLLM